MLLLYLSKMRATITKNTCGILTLFLLCLFVNAQLYAQKVAPLAVDDTYSGRLNRQLNINAINGLLSNDTDVNLGTILSVRPNPVTAPTNGIVSISNNGSFTYTPNTGFVGLDSFEYQVCDNGVPNPVVSRFDFDTVPLTNATTGPNASSINPNAVQTDCGIRIGSGAGGSAGLDFVVPNTGGIFNFESFLVNFEYRDQEGTADIVTAGNFRVFHISANGLGITLNVINGTTGLPATFTQTLGAFLGGNMPYAIEYDQVTGEINYTANGTLSTYNVAPPNSPLNTALSSSLIVGRFMDNSGTALPSICSMSFTDTSKLCDIGNVTMNINASIITNRKITFRVKPD